MTYCNWTRFFDSLGYEIVWSTPSTKEMYHSGQPVFQVIRHVFLPRLHGHIQQLIDKDVDVIFYPCMTYNVDEHQSDNHYNILFTKMNTHFFQSKPTFAKVAS